MIRSRSERELKDRCVVPSEIFPIGVKSSAGQGVTISIEDQRRAAGGEAMRFHVLRARHWYWRGFAGDATQDSVFFFLMQRIQELKVK